MKILLLNGPNLQLLGTREPQIYGKTTLKDIVSTLSREALTAGAELVDFQSNHEGDLVDRIGSAPAEGVSGIVFNPGAYTHTSVAIRDAIAAAALPVVEVHMSNIFGREEFRARSFSAPVSVGLFCGFGADTYCWALRALITKLKGETIC